MTATILGRTIPLRFAKLFAMAMILAEYSVLKSTGVTASPPAPNMDDTERSIKIPQTIVSEEPQKVRSMKADPMPKLFMPWKIRLTPVLFNP